MSSDRESESPREQSALDAWQPAGEADGPRTTADSERVCAATGARYGRREPAPDIEHGDEPAAERERDADVCQHCGHPVDARLRRLFGDNADVMWHCPHCVPTMGALAFGAGADPEFDTESDEPLGARNMEAKL